jgi:ubiquinone/menaquinone biosynthesis C-methylase UbiE
MLKFKQRFILFLIHRNIQRLIVELDPFMGKIKSLLDVGSGNGLPAFLISTKWPHIKISLLDISDSRYFVAQNLPHQIYDGISFPNPEAKYDAVLLSFVLHHAADPVHLLNECLQVSKFDIFIFEEVYAHQFQNKLMVWYDILINFLIFGEKISFPKFKTESEWQLIFRQLKVKHVDTVNLPGHWWMPPRRVFFRLSHR